MPRRNTAIERYKCVPFIQDEPNCRCFRYDFVHPFAALRTRDDRTYSENTRGGFDRFLFSR